MGGSGGEELGGQHGADGVVEVLVVGGGVVDGDGPHRLVAGSGGEGVGVAVAAGAETTRSPGMA